VPSALIGRSSEASLLSLLASGEWRYALTGKSLTTWYTPPARKLEKFGMMLLLSRKM
jgi:hypothetical protein